MLVYITGNTYSQIINEVITEQDIFVFGSEIKNDFDFLKYIKTNLTKLSEVEMLLVDTSVINNTDDEIIQAIENIKMMYDEMRVIVFAPYKNTGDDFLTKCFNLGILNIINTDDFVKIKKELEICMTTGKKFKDAVIYKKSSQEAITIKREIKQVVNKVMIGVAGADSRMGTTHNSIILANFLRSKGFMVAIAEMNNSGAFKDIQEGYNEKIFDEGYFTLNGVNYYADVDKKILSEILARSYNFIIIDFGKFEETDLVTFNKCEEQMLVVGSKPWEESKISNIFNVISDKKILEKYIYLFNFTRKEDEKAIRDGMADIPKIHFLNIISDPFSSKDFIDGEQILKKYMPVKQELEKKKGLLGKIKK